ncbi:MAG: zinc ribbon domain-containing protein [Dehalococcoidia bacterium]
MPIYEFRCQACRKGTSIFVKSVSSPIDAVCPSCGSRELIRLMSRFGISKTVKGVHQESAGPGRSAGSEYYKDPRNIGREVEQRFAEMGEEIPSGIRGMIDAAREGEMPGAVKDLQPNVKEL